MNSFKIILSTTFLAISYGILHDMINAHLCVEYFTIGHPKVIESTSPVTLALVWGVIATWWVGLPLGMLLAMVSQFGKRPVIPVKVVLRYAIYLLIIMFIVAAIFGSVAGFAAANGNLRLSDTYETLIPEKSWNYFLAAAWAHGASYLSGIVGTIVVSRLLYKRRNTLPELPIKNQQAK